MSWNAEKENDLKMSLKLWLAVFPNELLIDVERGPKVKFHTRQPKKLVYIMDSIFHNLDLAC